MALNRLLWYCLNQGTVLTEPGRNIGVSLAAKKGERTVFFRTDTQDFRQIFKARNERVCDGLVFYRQNGAAPRFIFVEFKSDDPGEAQDQIGSTAKIIGKHIPQDLPKPTLVGLVLLRHGVHRSRNRRNKTGARIPVRDVGFNVIQKSGVKGILSLRSLSGVLD